MLPVKICGLKNINDLDVSINYGASFGGFIFYENSHFPFMDIEVKKLKV